MSSEKFEKGGDGVAQVMSRQSALAGEKERQELERLGYTQVMKRNRSMLTVLFQSLAIAAIPYGEGGPLISAIYGGGQLAIFVGWIVVCVLDQMVAMSISELASRYPTSAGPYYWSFQLAGKKHRELLSFITCWIWLVGNWTISLSVNFGFASLVSALISMYNPDFVAKAWQLLLIFYAICLITLVITIYANDYLPMVDTICAGWTVLTIVVVLIALSVKADVGRHSPSYTLGNYDTSLSGWGGFTFFIGLLPPAYTFSAVGMVSSMAEEVQSPRTKLPWAISLCVPVGCIAGLFFVIPICATLPDLATLTLAPAGQALPYIFQLVMGGRAGGLGLTFLILVITLFCSISITVAASRSTWAAARDHALPGSRWFSQVNTRLSVPLNAVILVTAVEMSLGLIILGSSTAFTAFVSVGVIALELSYAIPIGASFFQGRREVSHAKFNLKALGWVANLIALVWIAFACVLFSMPTVLPTTETFMNYASVVLVGFMALSAFWYIAYARKVYRGPPESDGI